jgi:hypothetical protein
MTMLMQSQLDPLPRDLPFRIVSKTIGRGAYASYVSEFEAKYLAL